MRRDDRGDTLIEILLAISILGLSGAAVLGAMSTAVVGSRVGGDHSSAQSAVRTVAERLEGLTSSYVVCSVTTPASYATPTIAGYTVSPVTVEYWDGTFGGGTFVNSCPTVDRGVQRLSVTVTPLTSSAPASVSVVIRQAAKS